MDTVYSNISSSTMLRVYGTRPKGFQSVLIPHILKMIAGAIPSSPILMVQPTGSGKSAVPATVAVVDGGVTIVIENTLALAADQCSKIVSNAMDTSSQSIRPYHLDMIKNDNEIDEISSSIISHCAHNKSTSFILFTSPETLHQRN